MKEFRKAWILFAVFFVLFLILTVCVLTIDVRPVGPDGIEVGFAAVNEAVLGYFPGSEVWVAVTDYLGYLAIAIAVAFAAYGAVQLFKRKKLTAVQPEILLLGAVYLFMAIVYAFFWVVSVNDRPLLIDGVAKASYPSSHTMLTIVVFMTCSKLLPVLFPRHHFRILVSQYALFLLTFAAVCGRLASGYHWFTDVLGAVLISLALVLFFYRYADGIKEKAEEKKTEEN